MIGGGIKYHYFAVTNLSVLFQGNLSNHRGDFYCLNYFNSYTTKNKLKEHEEMCNNHNTCNIEMPDWVNKFIKHNPGEKSLKVLHAIFLDLECILKKLKSIQNNPEKSYTEKKPDISLLVGHYIQDVHLIKKKINLITIEEKIVLKNYVKNLKKVQRK